MKEYIGREPMISVKQFTKRYNELIAKYPIKPENRAAKYNHYVCGCGAVIKTVEYTEGTTPMMLKCFKCFNTAMSTFYDPTFESNKEPDIEWYRPELKEAMKQRKDRDMLEHILAGGLMFKILK